MSTCPHCRFGWTATRAEHCGATDKATGIRCCATFASSGAGDAHRVGEHNITDPNDPQRRRCLTGAEMRDRGLDKDDRGIWFDVVQRERANARWAATRAPASGAERVPDALEAVA